MVIETEGRNGRMDQRNGETQKDHTRISSSLLPSVVVVCSFSSNESGPGAFFFFAFVVCAQLRSLGMLFVAHLRVLTFKPLL